MKSVILSKYVISILVAFVVFGCSTSHRLRYLSQDEIKKYNLNGIINEVKICPTVFDDKLKASKIVGICQIVNCFEEKDEIQCTAVPE